MSEVNNNVEANNKFGITRRVLAFFNIGDDGKVDSFFIGLEKECKSEIARRKQNIGSLEFEQESTLANLNDDLEDAKLALENAWLNVNPETVGSTRESQKAYRAQYIAGIDRATATVEEIEDSIKDVISNYDKKIEKLEKEIKELNYRIEKINSVK